MEKCYLCSHVVELIEEPWYGLIKDVNGITTYGYICEECFTKPSSPELKMTRCK